MDLAALIISLVAVAGVVALGWQIVLWRQEPRSDVALEPRALTYVSPLGEVVPVVGVCVLNRNLKYPIRVNAVAFTPSTESAANLWFCEGLDLPRVIQPRDADTIYISIDHINEVEDPLGPSFTAWVELKTGEIIRSTPLERSTRSGPPN